MVQQGKLENIMLAIDSSNPLRITVLNQVPKALELLRQDPQVSRLSVDENKIAAWFSGSTESDRKGERDPTGAISGEPVSGGAKCRY